LAATNAIRRPEIIARNETGSLDQNISNIYFLLSSSVNRTSLRCKYHVTNPIGQRSFRIMRTRRKENSGPRSSAINDHGKTTEPTITQNGALYQVQHRQPSLTPPRIFSRLNFKSSKSKAKTLGNPLAHRPALSEPIESASAS